MERIKEISKLDATYQKLVQDVTASIVCHYWLEDGLLYAKGGKLFVPSKKIHRELLKETHDPQWAEHPGKERMYALLSRSYYWPKMELDNELYVKTCLVCQQDKGLTQREASLLQPLPIPKSPWIFVSMDFITGMPKVKAMGSIFVVVDRFLKYAMFMAAPSTCTAEVVVDLFYKNVVKYFGLPKDIVSDRDSRFTDRFWTVLFGLLGSKLKFSTANRPQIDGQTERINAVLEYYLRQYVTTSQKNWLDLLDSAQFAYNMHKSSSIEMSPFEVAMGQQPLTPHEIAKQHSGGRCLVAYRFAIAKQELTARSTRQFVESTAKNEKVC